MYEDLRGRQGPVLYTSETFGGFLPDPVPTYLVARRSSLSRADQNLIWPHLAMPRAAMHKAMRDGGDCTNEGPGFCLFQDIDGLELASDLEAESTKVEAVFHKDQDSCKAPAVARMQAS